MTSRKLTVLSDVIVGQLQLKLARSVTMSQRTYGILAGFAELVVFAAGAAVLILAASILI